MTKQWILSAVILGALFAVVIAFWLYGQFKLRRMRSLRCPVCHGAFSIPSLSAAQRWWPSTHTKAALQPDSVSIVTNVRLIIGSRMIYVHWVEWSRRLESMAPVPKPVAPDPRRLAVSVPLRG
jgi:hypothetical protein